MTEGQLYTAVLGVSLATITALIGIPPTLRDRPALPAFASEPFSTSTGDASGGDAPERPVGDGEPDVSVGTGPPVAPPPGPVADSGAAPVPVTQPGEPAPHGTGERLASPGVAVGQASRFAPVAGPGVPVGIATTPSGEVLALTGAAEPGGDPAQASLLQFSPRGDLRQRIDLGVTVGPGLGGVVAHGEGVAFVTSLDPPAVHRIDLRIGSARAWAPIADVPPCASLAGFGGPCQLAPVDVPPEPRGLAATADGTLYVADEAQGIIWRVPPGGGDAEVWDQRLDYLALSDGSGLMGLSLTSGGNLGLTIAGSLLRGGAGLVLEVEISGDGAPGELTEHATTEGEDHPSGLAVGASGHFYVALPQSGTVLVVNPADDGTTRLPAFGPLVSPLDVAAASGRILVAGADDTGSGRIDQIGAADA